MQVQLVALAYALLAILLGYVGSRALPPIEGRERFFAVWILITVSLFLSSNPFVFLGLSAAILFLAKPANRSQYFVFYIFTLHMVPNGVGALIPFPGLNYLIFLNFLELAAIVLLIPLLLRAPNKPAAGYNNTRLDQLVVLYFLLVLALGFRSLPLTSVVRLGVDFGLMMLVPYFAARNSISSIEDISRFIRFWVIVCVVLAIAALVIQYKSWNYYDAISGELFGELAVIRRGGSFRAGGIRTAATLGPTILGFALTIGVAFAQILKKQSGNKLIQLRLAQTLFLVAIFTTQSRGAWLALLVMAILYADLFSQLSATKIFRRMMLVVGGGIGIFMLQINSLLELDQYGTFEYRYNLILNSWQLIKQYPFFGLGGSLDNTVMEASRQGQGIIDVVNTYLAVAINYGIVGTLVFLLILALPIVILWILAKRLNAVGLEAERDICRLMIVVLTGLAVLLGTISWVGVLSQYMFLMVGIAAGAVGMAKAALAGPQQKEGFAGGAGSGLIHIKG